MKNAETWADENSDICENYIAVGELVDLIRAVQADALRAAAKAIDALTLLPDCEHSSQDYETGTHECALEINGRDCLCAQAVATAEACKTRILALINKEPKP